MEPRDVPDVRPAASVVVVAVVDNTAVVVEVVAAVAVDAVKAGKGLTTACLDSLRLKKVLGIYLEIVDLRPLKGYE